MAGMFHGWYVVFGAFLIALFGWGFGFYGPGVYLSHLTQTYGWSPGFVAGAVTAYYLAGAVLIGSVAGAFERFGPRLTVTGAALAMAAGVVAVSTVTQAWQVYPAFLLMAVGWAGLSTAAVNTVVAPWFEVRRGLAVSLALNGASLGGVIVAPMLVLLTDRFGFRPGLWLGLAAGLVLLLVPVWTLLRARPADLGLRPDGLAAPSPRSVAGQPGAAADWTWSHAVRSRRFWTIAAPFALALTAQVGFLTHQLAFLTPLLGAPRAALGVALCTAAAVVGRVATGFVVDSVDRRSAAAVNFAVQAAGMVLLALAATPACLYGGCILFGIGVGNQITLPALIVQREFPAVQFGRVVATVAAVNQFTFAFGPMILGVLRDRAGDYGPALAACTVALLVAAVLVLLRPRAAVPA